MQCVKGGIELLDAADEEKQWHNGIMQQHPHVCRKSSNDNEVDPVTLLALGQLLFVPMPGA